MKKYKYVGNTKLNINGKDVKNGDIISLSDNFTHVNFIEFHEYERPKYKKRIIKSRRKRK